MLPFALNAMRGALVGQIVASCSGLGETSAFVDLFIRLSTWISRS
jgi:hypothetical protein